MVEFRLYYDDTGKVLCYTCEKLSGSNYIVIDGDTYHQCRPDVYVIDGKIVRQNQMTIIRKLKPSNNGISCSVDDVSMITTENSVNWELHTSEYKN